MKIFKKLSLQSGFTLIELIMSAGILMILMGVFTGIFSSIIDAQLDSTATSGVDQDGRFVMARMVYDMQRAEQIVSPATPSSSTQPTMTIRIDSVDHVFSLNPSGNIQVQNNLGINLLNSYNTSIQNLSFQRLGVGDETDTVQVRFTVSSRITQAKGVESRDFQTTMGIR